MNNIDKFKQFLNERLTMSNNLPTQAAYIIVRRNFEVIFEGEIVKNTNKYPEDGIWYDGKHIPMSYEELVDLLAHYRDTGHEETLKREKCAKAFGEVIPMTSY